MLRVYGTPLRWGTLERNPLPIQRQIILLASARLPNLESLTMTAAGLVEQDAWKRKSVDEILAERPNAGSDMELLALRGMARERGCSVDEIREERAEKIRADRLREIEERFRS